MKALTSDAGDRGGATIYQVAQHAGVSIATVSRVLRGTAPVSEAARARVLTAVDHLGYRPSRLGRSLAEGRHAAYGIVFPDLSGPYFAELVLGYEEVAAELGCSVLILATHGRAAVRDKVLDLASRVDGMVVLARTVEDDVLTDLNGKGMPLVTVARPAVGGADGVRTDNAESSRRLTEHLAGDHGYRSFAFLGDAQQSPDTAQRWSAFREGLRAAGVAAPRQPVRCSFEEESGRLAALQALRRTRRPRALVCANDEIALGAVRAAEELGLRVPEDVAVTGWDDVMAARHSRPGLTTVRQPVRRLGAWAARRLHARIDGDTSPAEHVVLPTELVLRRSCGDHP